MSELELTWEEISALMGAARDREQMLRIRGSWARDLRATELIESALAKLRTSYHTAHERPA